MTVELVAVGAAIVLGMGLMAVAVAVAMTALDPGQAEKTADKDSYPQHPLLVPGR